jgi:uncharacterized protein (TIGR02611 family)
VIYGLCVNEAMTRWRERIRQHALLNNVWRLGVFTVGAAVLLAGVAMLVLPGPGWAAIFVGFAILATEFAWAQAVLNRAKDMATKAKDKALDPRVRRRNQIIAVVAGLAVAAAIIAYLAVFGLNLPWNA